MAVTPQLGEGAPFNVGAPCFVLGAKQSSNEIVAEFEDTHGAFDRGTKVLLVGLMSKEMNGKLGEILSWDEAGFRFRVRLGSGVCKAVRPENLAAVGSKMYECYLAGEAAFATGDEGDSGCSEHYTTDLAARAALSPEPTVSPCGGRKARRRKKPRGGEGERGSSQQFSVSSEAFWVPRDFDDDEPAVNVFTIVDDGNGGQRMAPMSGPLWKGQMQSQSPSSEWGERREVTEKKERGGSLEQDLIAARAAVPLTTLVVEQHDLA